MDPGSSTVGVTTLYGAAALVIIALVPFLRDLVGVFRTWLEHRWNRNPTPPLDPPPKGGYVDTLSPDVIWLNREVSRLERTLEAKKREAERCVGEVEQLRGEVEFLVDQLQEAVRERDEALAREARLRRERRR